MQIIYITWQAGKVYMVFHDKTVLFSIKIRVQKLIIET